MIVVIPKKHILFCDICKNEVSELPGKFSYNEEFEDFSGEVVGGRTSQYDICDSCCEKILKIKGKKNEIL